MDEKPVCGIDVITAPAGNSEPFSAIFEKILPIPKPQRYCLGDFIHDNRDGEKPEGQQQHVKTGSQYDPSKPDQMSGCGCP